MRKNIDLKYYYVLMMSAIQFDMLNMKTCKKLKNSNMCLLIFITYIAVKSNYLFIYLFIIYTYTKKLNKLQVGTFKFSTQRYYFHKKYEM